MLQDERQGTVGHTVPAAFATGTAAGHLDNRGPTLQSAVTNRKAGMCAAGALQVGAGSFVHNGQKREASPMPIRHTVGK